MQRRQFLKDFVVAGAITLLPVATVRAEAFSRVNVSPGFWRDKLSQESWDVLFQEATERPWSSPLNEEKRSGTYLCAACYLPLFSADDKYDSGTGWPSFVRPIDDRHIGKHRDFKLIIPRTEYHCARCGGHQGHVFSDGPPPGGQRWCNNGVALHFVAKGDPLPALRGE